MVNEDRANYNEILRILASPYRPKIYEKNKAADKDPKKTFQQLLMLKYRHHHKFFHEYLGTEQPLLEHLLSSFVESRSIVLENAIERLFEMIC